MSVNPTSRWEAQDYAANAGFVPALGAPVLALLDPQPGEHILDLGCGDGVLTAKIADAGAIVVGVDAADTMVAAALARGLDARVADGEALAFGPEFDAVFSNAALHWMLDRGAVAAGVFRSLKPGGRFVGEMGGHGNIAKLRAALHAELAARGYTAPVTDPQWYPTPDEFVHVYAAAGFVDVDAKLIPRPTPLPAGVAGWLRTFRAGFMDTANVPDAEQAEVAQAVEKRLEQDFLQPDGVWVADYVRLRFSMRKAS
ncbi:Ubiquinone/menaquinone biosynthesis C-methylase UbiE [Sphingomonas laterariae]|uniref:Ubiquinone/menaquinone biosynthesis C-methylase UbiE n=1 Tax=Edaphosphingomonas laterariae TaxID=861865 RepID=A0A239BCA0_9SPHN|nr:class I SAM-dependent methyltransferase [Sphingomonas laterariae]SNS05576.1 Ubiquinone/menaquinone biosynthesis C-methylase UbiE [Sphingomonas laterariae]